MMVLIFKTNIKLNQTQYVKELLQGVYGVQSISFDLEDCDKILKVVSNHKQIEFVEGLLSSKGILCKELDD